MTAHSGARLSDVANFYDANGVGILNTPQDLTVTIEGGGSASIKVYSNDTIALLGEKLNAALAEASGTSISDLGAAQYVTDGLLPPNVDDEILNGLATNWLWGAGKRLAEAYGLTANGETLYINFAKLNGASAIGGSEYVNGELVGTLTFDRDQLIKDAASGHFLDRQIAHELTHALVIPGVKKLYESSGDQKFGDYMWLVEGLPQYIQGANSNLKSINKSDLVNTGSIMNRLLNAGGLNLNYRDVYTADPASTLPGGLPNWESYSAAYLSTRYFDEMSLKNGGTGIKGMLMALDSGAATDLDSAMKMASNNLFSDYSAFKNVILSNNSPSVASENYRDFLDRVYAEDPNFDTGAIGGYYATVLSPSGTAQPLSPSDVISGNDTYSLNPLADWGWGNVIWPQGMPDDGAGPAGVVATAAPKDGSLQSVNGTLLLHSPLLGNVGRISLSGDERLIKALGFMEIQSAVNTVYDFSISDAHSGSLIKSGVRISGNTLYGELQENIDVRLTNNFAIKADGKNLASGGYGTFVFSEGGADNFILHIAADSVVLQIGANQGENMLISFGDTSSAALGVDKVNVTDRELAARAVTIIDNAINKVSTKRARLGAYQNRLEHTITNLTAASANTTASESRIRDADMAKEMINFTRLNILSQAGSSMLGQANQFPQSVLTLTR
jgi:flagellin-like hook-associated protein FlgL